MLSQLGPILEQLAGVDLDDFLRGIASLPQAAVQRMSGGSEAADAPTAGDAE